MSSQKTVTLRKNNQNKSDSFAFFIAPGYAVIFILSLDAPYLNIQPYYRISIWHYSVMVFRYSHSLCQSFLIDSRKLPPAILLNTIRGTVAKLAGDAMLIQHDFAQKLIGDVAPQVLANLS